VVLNQKLDKILENQKFIKVHIHSAKHDEITLGNDFLEIYQKFIPIKCKQDLIEIENLLTNELTFKVNLVIHLNIIRTFKVFRVLKYYILF